MKILPVGVGVAALVIGCGREAPLPPLAVTKVVDLVEVNTSGGFVDSVALSADGSLVATGQRNGPGSATTERSDDRKAVGATPHARWKPASRVI